MKSPFELEIAAEWRREQLLREAAVERLVARVPRQSLRVRARLARALYALAYRLCSDAVPVAHRWERV
jgi:hypothetical protein